MSFEPYRPLFSRVLARPQVYLANHSLGRPLDRVSTDVQRALDMWYERMDENWEGGGWLEELALWRANTAQLLGLSRGDCVVPKSSAGHALRSVLNAFVGERPVRVVSTTGEFDSIDFVLKTYEAKGVAEVRWVGPSRSDRGVLLFDSADIDSAIRPGVQLVVLSRVFFTTGQILQDFERVVEAAHSVGAVVVVDVYHAAGVIPLQMEELGWDFAIGGSYKYLRGGPGACWLALHPRSLGGGIRSLDTGWFAKADTFGYERTVGPQYKEGGDGWLESTPAILLPYQAKSGLEFVLGVGVDNLRKNSLSQLRVMHNLFKLHGLRLYEPEDFSQFGAFALLPHEGASELARILGTKGIVVDSRQGMVRFGPDFLNTAEEFEKAASSLKSLL